MSHKITRKSKRKRRKSSKFTVLEMQKSLKADIIGRTAVSRKISLLKDTEIKYSTYTNNT